MIRLILALASLALLAAMPAIAQDGEPPVVELELNEQALVSYHRQETLWRRQIYRETSMRLAERRATYQKDMEKAKEDRARFAQELEKVEANTPVDLVELERVLNGIKAAEKAIDICLEALVVVDTAAQQFAKHRELIEKSRARLRKSLGAEKGQCGLHKAKLDLVRVPVVKPGPEPTAEEMLQRIRNFPMPAEPFETPEAGNPGAPATIAIPVCPACTAAKQAWLKNKRLQNARSGNYQAQVGRKTGDHGRRLRHTPGILSACYPPEKRPIRRLSGANRA